MAEILSLNDPAAVIFLLQQVSARLNSAGSHQAIFQALSSGLGRLGLNGLAALVNAQQDTLAITLLSTSSEEQPLFSGVSKIMPAHQFPDASLLFGKCSPVFEADLRSTLLRALPASDAPQESQPGILLPLHIQNKVVGLLGCWGPAAAKDNHPAPGLIELLQSLCSIAALQIENLRLNQLVSSLSTIDELTGALNQANFTYIGERELTRSHRYHRQLGMIIFEIDGFHRFSEKNGASIAEQTQRAVILRCRQSIRQQLDFIGRLKNNEYALILPETSLSDSSIVAERLRKNVLLVSENAVSASFGVTALHKPDQSLLELIEEARFMLELAKRNGPNRVVAYFDSNS